ncbi:RAF-like serine/threonine-protein kinase 20 isoform X1 [Primulina tabacum]|uniref:RAF-like serine/threonine-protein kinase 20 isoform X1 n=2 Tax=Primulina tabacum TaxID=48773 RepID=UPI003F5A0FE9
MAFDQNSIPKSLRPLNIVRTVAEDPRIALAVTSSGKPMEGFYANPCTDLGGSPGSNPAVYYPATVHDAQFINLGLNNAVPGVGRWVQNVVPPPYQTGVVGPTVNSTTGYTCAPSVGTRGVGSDHASDEGGDDSVSGRKVKFLCSFGGKILPRPSDGTLRYVGGQTRIISIRRGASFGEFVQKMIDICGQSVVIKYQLPDEELDALVSVSGPDDLENMMDEYEKLIERSSDGSSKLRIFLFSPSEIESPVPIHIGDFQDSGQKYVEAVNGIMDRLSVAGQIARKESIESADSAQNSDLSVTEGAESSSPAQGEAHGLPFNCGFSPMGNPRVPLETSSRMIYADPNPAPHIDPSVGPSPEQEVDRHVPLTVPHSVQGMAFPAAPYMQTYLDSHRETLNPASHVQLPSQMGFPSQILQAVSPVYTQQSIPTVALPQQFPPSIHMTTNPSIMNPSAVPSLIQPRQVRVEHYPSEHAVSRRVVQLPPEQGHSTHHAQAPSVYNWHQILHPEQITFSEGGLSPQPVLVSDVIPRFEDCYMCQKALPHAHSDTIAQEQKEFPLSTLTDSRSVYRSLYLDDRGHTINRPAVTGALSEGFTEQLSAGALPKVAGKEDRESGYIQTEGSGVSRKFEEQNMDEKTIHQKPENPEHSKVKFPLGMMATSAVQSPFGMLVTNTPQPMQANTVQPQRQGIQGSTISMPLNNDFVPVGCMPLQTSDVFGVSQFASKLAGGNPRDDSPSAFDHLRQIDGRLENLHIRPSEIIVENEMVKSVAESREKDILEAQQRVSTSWLPSRMSGDKETFTVEGNSTSSMYPSSRVGEIPDNSASLFSNQDPWNLRLDSHFPPPRPNKLIRENAGPGNYLNPVIETPVDNAADPPRGNLNQDFNLNHISSNKVKVDSDELIKQELQAVAEGVVASVLHSSVPSNSELSPNSWSDSSPMTQQNGEIQPPTVEMQPRDKFEEIKAKLPEKINLGFPASDGMGRLQIIKNSDLEELRELGSGTFGTVYHGKWRGTDVAIKRINDRCFAGKPSEQERMRDDFWNEAIKLADLHHPNVVAFYGVVLDCPGGTVATVTEYMVNGSLRNALQKSERILDKRKRLLISMDVAFGMEYLHAKNIVHFDLKSDNLLVNLRDPHRPICKVGDLGLSKVKCQTLISGGVRGTLPWMAPELLNGSSSLVSEKVDVFSFGIVMWELLTREEPYADLHYGAIIGGIVSNTLRPPVPEPCDPDWRDLMERCWSSEPSERPNFTEIANELRAIAAKLPPKGQQQVLSPNSQVKS